MDHVTGGRVVLVTDFGTSDPYVAEMKLAMLARLPGLVLVDGTHEVPVFDRVAAALAIERITARLERGDGVCAVVDPGVGTERRRLVARRDGLWWVGPDNGILPLAGADVWRIDRRFAPHDPSTTFDGRDVFGPAAAWMAAGVHPGLLGPRATDLVPSVLPPDAAFHRGEERAYAEGVIVALDRYGNAVTNVRPAPGAWAVVEPGSWRGPLARAYGAVGVGEPVALVGSSGRVELARRERPSGLSVGDRVRVEFVS